MTTPVQASSDQILIKLGEMGIQLAHIEEQLKPVAAADEQNADLFADVILEARGGASVHAHSVQHDSTSRKWIAPCGIGAADVLSPA